MVFSMTTDKGIFIQNIYYMLSYAFQVLQQQDYQCIASEKFEHIDDLFAAILAKGVSRQLKQGLYREYVSRSETRSVLRESWIFRRPLRPASSISPRSPVPLTSFRRTTCITRS